MEGRGEGRSSSTAQGDLTHHLGLISIVDDDVSVQSGVIMKAFSEAISNYKANGMFLDEDVASLAFLLGRPTIEGVLELVDENHVTVMRTPMSGKVLVRVYGNKPCSVYWIPPGKSICQCQNFIIDKKGYCKHILAAHLALAIHSPEEYEDITETEITEAYRTKILKLKK